MKFAASVSALAAFVSVAVAQAGDFDPVNLPEKNAELPAGKPFEVTWDVPEAYKDGTVSIHLIGGKDQGHQVPLADIAAGIPNSDGKYTWDVAADLGEENVYGLIVKWEANPDIFQYSKPFTIAQGEGEEKHDADETKTISKAYGTKTISLQTAEKETTTSCSTTSMVTPPVETIVTPTSTPIVTPPVESTTIVKKPSSKPAPKPKETDVVEEPKEEPTQAPKPSEVPVDSGASSFGASAVALVGAFVVAAFAL